MSLQSRLRELEKQFNNLTKAEQDNVAIGGKRYAQIVKLKEEIAQSNDVLGKNKDQIDSINDVSEKATTILQKMGKVAEHAGNAIGGVADAAYNGERAFGDLNSAIKSSINLTKEGAGLLDEFIPTTLIDKIPLLGKGVNATLSAIGSVGGVALDFTADSIGLFNKVTGAVDKTTKAHRNQVKTIFKVGRMYGDSVEGAEKFTSSMRKAISSDFGKSVNLTMGQMNSFMASVANTNLNLKDMSQSTSIAGKETTALAAAAAQ